MQVVACRAMQEGPKKDQNLTNQEGDSGEAKNIEKIITRGYYYFTVIETKL